ncbi:unnamed protein product [Allacma fusca]|uniref:Uncharacterized protein n=1 Tax=Allacma fusca TaxID=39272 RepID=A0A8J2LAZ8_9HEXA|nr:unnamed protein product [Allacma fusca]
MNNSVLRQKGLGLSCTKLLVLKQKRVKLRIKFRL